MQSAHIDLLCQFIPIILLFLYLRYPMKMNDWSVTILGKLLALSLIVFYTCIDKLYGLAVCVLVIFYYHRFYIEGLETLTDTLRTQFESQNCQNGKLIHKNMEVKSEMASHIFPEIKYTGYPCNPCDNLCQYDVIEEKRMANNT